VQPPNEKVKMDIKNVHSRAYHQTQTKALREGLGSVEAKDIQLCLFSHTQCCSAMLDNHMPQ